jgi:hypothetical protein
LSIASDDAEDTQARSIQLDTMVFKQDARKAVNGAKRGTEVV